MKVCSCRTTEYCCNRFQADVKAPCSPSAYVVAFHVHFAGLSCYAFFVLSWYADDSRPLVVAWLKAVLFSDDHLSSLLFALLITVF